MVALLRRSWGLIGRIWRTVLRYARLVLRFRLSTLLLLTAVLAMALGWRQDRQRLMRQLHQLQNPGPRWEAQQAAGPPDTLRAGDIPTAWASRTPDGQQEWLILEFERSVVPTAILVYETFNPGAVCKATHFPQLGGEQLLWEGTDPTPTHAKMGISRLPVAAKVATDRIKLYIDSSAVPGWNEIDAVGLVHENGEVVWATRAKASSSYVDQPYRSYRLVR